MSHIPVIDTATALANKKVNKNYKAFYNHELGGVITDPRFMVLSMDDHMVHRGHAVFDTANVKDGYCYGLNFHLDRFLRSAKLAQLDVEEKHFPKEKLREIILATVAASQLQNGIFVKYWLSAGTGNFDVSSLNLERPNFYCMVTELWDKELYSTVGVKEVTVKTSDVPLKPTRLATMKSNNYLLNAIVCDEARKKGGYIGLQYDPVTKIVYEGSIGNIAIVDQNNVFKTVPFDNILAGTTVKRLMEIIKTNINSTDNNIPKLNGCELVNLKIDEVYNAKEVISLGGGGIVPITILDDAIIADGKVGVFFQYFLKHLLTDLKENQDQLDRVPYELYASSY